MTKTRAERSPAPCDRRRHRENAIIIDGKAAIEPSRQGLRERRITRALSFDPPLDLADRDGREEAQTLWPVTQPVQKPRMPAALEQPGKYDRVDQVHQNLTLRSLSFARPILKLVPPWGNASRCSTKDGRGS